MDMSDTNRESRQQVRAAHRRQSPERRLEIAMQASQACWEMVRSDVHERFPGASLDQLDARFLQRWLGARLGREVADFRRSHPLPARGEE